MDQVLSSAALNTHFEKLIYLNKYNCTWYGDMKQQKQNG